MATIPGLGGGGAVGLAFETTMGTYVAPTVWVPIISESLDYNSDPYVSEQIRQQSMHFEAKPSYYHVEGDIELEADAKYLPYLLYSGRHTVVKTGAGSPWTYKFVPNSSAVLSTATGTTTQKTLSITTLKNGEWFGFTGCGAVGFEFRVDTDSGILMCTFNMMGLAEAEPASATPSWAAPSLFGADAHDLYLDAAGTGPTFAALDLNHNGFTFNVNFNGKPEPRVRADRSASYISMGITEGTVSGTLDFLDRQQYDDFKAVTKKAYRFESLTPGGGATTLATATEGVRLQANNVFYTSFPIPLAGMGDLISADFEGSMLGITGGNGYEVHVVSTAAIT